MDGGVHVGFRASMCLIYQRSLGGQSSVSHGSRAATAPGQVLQPGATWAAICEWVQERKSHVREASEVCERLKAVSVV